MFSQIEEEHKIKSHDIARELKRRSYMENDKGYEISQERRYPGLDREQFFSKSSVELDKLEKLRPKFKPPGYRHSYAEPKLSMERLGKKHPEMIHRTNSSVSNSGRVGIASVNPY